MQTASASGASGGGGRSLKKWGPIAGVVAVAAIGIGVMVATGGDDDESSDTTAATAPDTTAPAGGDSTVPGTDTTVPTTGGDLEVTYPLSYADAVDQGIADQIDWGDSCDTSTGRVAVPDYFAPECFAFIGDDNGGATATGVTAEEITLVYYEGMEGDPIINYITDAIAVDDTNADQFETMAGFVAYYEAYYQLYGRSVNLVTFEGTGGASDDVAARADAVAIVEEYKPFAVLGGPALTNAFADELAAREVVCIGCTPGQPAEFYADRDPYVWGLDGSALQKQSHVLEFLEKQVIGKNAEYGGDAVKDQPRRFGLVYIESSDASTVLAESFATGMEDLGAPFAEMVAYQLDPATIQQQAAQVITRLKAAGVTSIVFTGDPVAPRSFTKEATAQEYYPEWIVAASGLVDLTAFARGYDQAQWQHAFGVTQLAARSDPLTTGAYADYVWFTGEDPPADGTVGSVQPNAALFFAGVQEAGPILTPENFREGLASAARNQAGHRQALPQLWRQGLLGQRSRLPRCRRCHCLLVGSRRHRCRRDRQGGHRHVPVRRRWPEVPARGLDDRREAVRPRWRGGHLHHPATRRGTRRLPQPGGLTASILIIKLVPD